MLTIGNSFRILSPKGGNSFTNLSMLQFMHDILTIDSIVFHFFTTNIAIPHLYNNNIKPTFKIISSLINKIILTVIVVIV